MANIVQAAGTLSGQPNERASGARAPDHDHLRWLREHALPAGGWAGKSVLDLGCGSGFLCAEAARQGAKHVVGVDVLPPDVPPALWQFRALDLERERWDEAVPQAGPGTGGFDLICAFDILEHLSAPARFVDGCRRLLAPDGRFVLTTPNTASWERLLKGERWSGATDIQHKILFTRYSLAFLLRRLGLVPEVLVAPVRKVARLGIPCPQIGAQIFCVAAPSRS